MKKCISNDNLYLSNPPQRKCKDCLTFWVEGNELPVCKIQKYSEAKDILNQN